MKRYVSTFIVLLMVLTACATPTQIPPTITLTQTQTKLQTATQTQDTNSEFNVQSELIRGILEQTPEVGICYVYGDVHYAGQPIINYTDTQPNFWVRDEDKGNEVQTEVTYDPLYGEYLYRLQAGTYGISATVVLGESYPTPGDYTSFTQITVEESQLTLNKDLSLTRIIHLTSPFDNMETLDLEFDPQNFGYEIPVLESKTILFSWDAIPEASAYHLTITEVQFNLAKNLPWKNIRIHFDDRLADTSLEIELPSSLEDHFYSVRLYAIDQAENYVGSLMIRLPGGWGWDVKFQVP